MMKNLIIFNFRLIILLTLSFSFSAVAQTSLWQITNGDKRIFLGGTVHILSQDDYPLPVEFEQAFLKSKKIVFETDIALAKSPEFAQKLSQQMTYPPGESLEDVLSKQTYQRLADYFSDKMPMAQINVLKPGMVVVILSAIEFQNMGMVLTGVDDYFWNRAQENVKQIDTLETLDEQLSFLVNMGDGQENELILNTLNELKEIKSMVSSLKIAWRTGNEAGMGNIVLLDMVNNYPQLYQSMLVNRNHNWMDHIESLLHEPEDVLVLVGALHLVGDDGLLQLLRNKGYTVEHFFQQ